MTTDKVFGKDRTWSFITENGLSYFVPYVLRVVNTAWAADDQFFYHGMQKTILSGQVSDYLAVVPRDVVVNHLNDLLLDKEELSAEVFTQINRLNLLDLESASRMRTGASL